MDKILSSEQVVNIASDNLYFAIIEEILLLIRKINNDYELLEEAKSILNKNDIDILFSFYEKVVQKKSFEEKDSEEKWLQSNHLIFAKYLQNFSYKVKKEFLLFFKKSLIFFICKYREEEIKKLEEQKIFLQNEIDNLKSFEVEDNEEDEDEEEEVKEKSLWII